VALTAILASLGYGLYRGSRAEVTVSAQALAAPPASSPASALTAFSPPAHSIAVLPFLNMSGDKEQEYFSDGLSEELIDRLTNVADLRVPARTSSFYFKGKQTTIADIAKALGVAHVLEGSVRKSGDTLRVTAQLIRVDNGYHVWSETYDRKLGDIFKVQDEIATAVVGALKLKLLEAPTTKDPQTAIPAAHDQYLIGRQLLSGGNYAVDRNAAAAFRRAVNLDPKYASAWAALAEATLDTDANSPAEFNAHGQEAQAAADKAIALRPDLADGYIARGYFRSLHLLDFVGADKDFRHALSIEPQNSEALFRYSNSVLMPTGRLDSAVALARQAVQSDPFNADAWARLGGNQFYRGDYLAARESWRRSLEINPQQSWVASSIALTFLLTGEPAKALPLSQGASGEEFRLQGAALAEHDLGNGKGAEQRLAELIAKHADDSAFQIAEIYAWWGDKGKALQWLERAYVQHDAGLNLVKVDPLLKNLHMEPWYKALLQKMNLPE
jgi:TolB-like protein